MAKNVLWIIVACIGWGLYYNAKHHIDSSRWGLLTLIGIVCFIAIIEVVERKKS